jgi:ribosomal protein S1
MKKVIAIVVSVLFVLSVTGLSFAADQKAAAPAKAEEKKTDEKKAPEKVNQVTGVVVAVDAKAKTLTVKGKKSDIALSVDEKAAKNLAGLKVGDKVTVKYTEKDGKNVATSVAAKKAEEKKEAAPAAAAPKADEKKPAAPAAKPAEKKKTGGY